MADKLLKNESLQDHALRHAGWERFERAVDIGMELREMPKFKSSSLDLTSDVGRDYSAVN